MVFFALQICGQSTKFQNKNRKIRLFYVAKHILGIKKNIAMVMTMLFRFLRESRPVKL